MPYGLKHLEEDKDQVGGDIMNQLRDVITWLPSDDELVVKTHKWRYSQVSLSGQLGLARSDESCKYW